MECLGKGVIMDGDGAITAQGSLGDIQVARSAK